MRSVLFLMVVSLLTMACDRELLGLPRVPVSVPSPDGRAVAFVRNHPTIDGPDQSVWLVEGEGAAKQIRRLGGDIDWCNTIVWSADGSTVGFLIQDARLLTVDRRSMTVISEKWLVENRDYPPSGFVTALALSDDGREAIFQSCRRRRGGGFRPGSCNDARALVR
jgi:hypothetical protein